MTLSLVDVSFALSSLSAKSFCINIEITQIWKKKLNLSLTFSESYEFDRRDEFKTMLSLDKVKVKNMSLSQKYTSLLSFLL